MLHFLLERPAEIILIAKRGGEDGSEGENRPDPSVSASQEQKIKMVWPCVVRLLYGFCWGGSCRESSGVEREGAARTQWRDAVGWDLGSVASDSSLAGRACTMMMCRGGGVKYYFKWDIVIFILGAGREGGFIIIKLVLLPLMCGCPFPF